MNEIATVSPADQIMEQVLAKGDLSKLTSDERSQFYMETCRSVGLNPLTRPFEYMVLNGKTVMYARKDAAEQLRKMHGINIEVINKELQGDLFCVTVRATDKSGRVDEDMGVVVMPKSGAAEVKANMILKAITKAKRRVTLSICGLGFMDESEIEDIRAEPKAKGAVRTVTSADLPNLTQEVPSQPNQPADAAVTAGALDGGAPEAPAELSMEAMAREAATRGRDIFNVFYKGRTRDEQTKLRGMRDELEALMA